ncbi:hypothetical protein [Corynebacterium tuberculostearicum]|uniref:hypothetical protein n=1 Tax=Corynebacterium tuberculostearicum TaxID=38304 RepID=UPI0020271DE2|nr:hypothetical protein [Corynebacterium tuberculostearicum]MCG7459829.1 hypothetical protein [Corynebacterium tuberculostearicum]
MSEVTKHYAVDLTRIETAQYRATNSAGASIDFGSGEVSQVLFRLSRWENLEYAKKI